MNMRNVLVLFLLCLVVVSCVGAKEKTTLNFDVNGITGLPEYNDLPVGVKL